MQSELERIRHDVQCAQGKIGLASAQRLFNLLEEMIQRIEKLERQQLRDHGRLGGST